MKPFKKYKLKEVTRRKGKSSYNQLDMIFDLDMLQKGERIEAKINHKWESGTYIEVWDKKHYIVKLDSGDNYTCKMLRTHVRRLK